MVATGSSPSVPYTSMVRAHLRFEAMYVKNEVYEFLECNTTYHSFEFMWRRTYYTPMVVNKHAIKYQAVILQRQSY